MKDDVAVHHHQLQLSAVVLCVCVLLVQSKTLAFVSESIDSLQVQICLPLHAIMFVLLQLILQVFEVFKLQCSHQVSLCKGEMY